MEKNQKIVKKLTDLTMKSLGIMASINRLMRRVNWQYPGPVTAVVRIVAENADHYGKLTNLLRF